MFMIYVKTDKNENEKIRIVSWLKMFIYIYIIGFKLLYTARLVFMLN